MTNSSSLPPPSPKQTVVLMSVLDLLKPSLPTLLILLLLNTVKLASCHRFKTCTIEN